MNSRDTDSAALPLTRLLGRTGRSVGLFCLGGEGVLRTTGREAEAVAVVRAALDAGVNYFDTSPLYEQSEDYLGAGLVGRRGGVLVATKTHDRTRDGSLRLLDQSLARLQTDVIDVWQLHDMRTADDLDRVFAPDGAIRAMELARADGRVRHLGVTGHYDPAILSEALRRFPFDTLLVSINAADTHHRPFATTVVAEAAACGVGVIGMKVAARGKLLTTITIRSAIGYALSVPGMSGVIVGCGTPAEVAENARIAREFEPLPTGERRRLEALTGPVAEAVSWYRRPLE